jgi:hypothetical protein
MSEPTFSFNPDDPLARIPGEPETAHLALHDYAGLPDGQRSLDTLTRHYRGADSAPTRRLRTLKEWSTRYLWQERVAQAQALRLAAERAQREAVWMQRREQTREDSWALAQQLRDRAIALLAHPTTEETHEQVTRRDADGRTVEVIQVTIRPSRWAQRDIPVLAETYDKLARLAAGMDTSQQKVVVEGLEPKDLADLSDEELDKLEAQLQKRRK